jgi:hypothetical protein
VGKEIMQQSRQKRLRGGADAGTRQHSPLLQTPRQGLRRGSFRDPSEQLACRYDWKILRQARATSQPGRRASRGQNKRCHAGAMLQAITIRGSGFEVRGSRLPFPSPLLNPLRLRLCRAVFCPCTVLCV